MKNKNTSISLIRFISMMMIVSCHIFQSINSELAWWFNVGVQIFLLISGFLYGQKEIDNYVNWDKQRLYKLVSSYYTYIAIIGVIYLLFAKDLFSKRAMINHILCIQQFKGGLKGIEHLWFISFIIICYLITPILQSLYDNLMKDKKEVKFWVILFSIIIFVQFMEEIGLIGMNVPNLSCYILGYFISRRYYNAKYVNSSDKLSLLQTTVIFTIASILSNGMVIYYKYYRRMENMAGGNLFFDFSHMLLGISLFFIMYSIFNKIDKRFINRRIIDCMDRYSFEIYIVHQIYILGRFSLMNLTDSLWINITIVVIAIIISALALKLITNFIMKVISQVVSNIKSKKMIY